MVGYRCLFISTSQGWNEVESMEDLKLDALRAFAEKELPSYKLPTCAKLIKEIPLNVMGKMNKKQLVDLFKT